MTFPCPYCRSRPRTEKGLRDHLAEDRCRQVPPEVQISVVLASADSWTEAEFARLAAATFRRAGWMAFHSERGRGERGDWMTNTSEPGLPDWLFIRPPHLVFIEMKKQSGRATRDQVKVIASIQACTEVEAWFARPSDWATLVRIREGA